MIVFLLLPDAVRAEAPAPSLSYPVAELGSCQNQEACKAYCDKSENMSACVDFGLSQGLIEPGEAAIAKKAIEKIKAGQTPGNCRSQEECSNYCQNNASDMKNCIAFAEEIGVPAEEIAQAKQVAAALEKGAGLPGNCQGKTACEAYCSDSNHIDECLVFAEAAQILPAEEIAEAKKMAKFLKNGEMPGGCKKKSDCQAYCAIDSNFEECINFAEKTELIPKEEIEMARKTGGKGPGGCKNKTDCEAYCNQQQNAKACADFAVEKGILSEEETENIKNGVAKIKSGLKDAPPEIKPDVEACLNNLFGGNLAAVLNGEQTLTQAQGNKVGSCFEEAAKRYAEQQKEKMQSPAGQTGQSGQPPSQEQIQQMMQNAPDEAKAQIQEQINQQIKERGAEEAQKNMPAGVPQGAPPVMPDVPQGMGMPGNIPTGPGGAVPAPPAGVNAPVGQIPPGAQGPPCNSPEECQAMFGGGPPAGVPQQ